MPPKVYEFRLTYTLGAPVLGLSRTCLRKRAFSFRVETAEVHVGREGFRGQHPGLSGHRLNALDKPPRRRETVSESLPEAQAVARVELGGAEGLAEQGFASGVGVFVHESGAQQLDGAASGLGCDVLAHSSAVPAETLINDKSIDRADEKTRTTIQYPPDVTSPTLFCPALWKRGLRTHQSWSQGLITSRPAPLNGVVSLVATANP